MAKPIVKWAGGKTRLLDELMARVPQKFGRYFEPFAGGAALFFRLAPERAVISDINADLINCYRQVAINLDAVIGCLAVHRRMHHEAYYYETREWWNAAPDADPIARAAAFIYLNKTCFNGLWRVNRRGHFNVPMGRYENPKILDVDGLRAASKVLARASIVDGNYRYVMVAPEAGDLVYLDPPYQPLTATSNFTGYTGGGFGEEDQRHLARIVGRLRDRGCHVLVSNSDTPLIRELYADFDIATVKCGRGINSKASARGKVNEVLVNIPGREPAQEAA